MSAAAPADPTPPTLTVNNREGAAVIDITRRRGPRGPQHTQGGWTMGTPPTPPDRVPPQGDYHAALRLIADDMEKAFNADGRTLSDDETAADYVRTLRLVEHALQGAAARGVITEDQLRDLAVLIQGMKEAPRLI